MVNVSLRTSARESNEKCVSVLKSTKMSLRGLKKVVNESLRTSARESNEKGVSVLKSTKNGIASALQKIRHTQLAVLELNGICDFVVYYFCLLSFKIPLLVRSHS